MVEGRAVQVTDNDTLRRLAEAWVMKWDGRWRFEVGEDCFLHSGLSASGPAEPHPTPKPRCFRIFQRPGGMAITRFLGLGQLEIAGAIVLSDAAHTTSAADVIARFPRSAGKS